MSDSILEWWIPKCTLKKTKRAGRLLELELPSFANYVWAVAVAAAASWGNANLKGNIFIIIRPPKPYKCCLTIRNICFDIWKLVPKARKLWSQEIIQRNIFSFLSILWF